MRIARVEQAAHGHWHEIRVGDVALRVGEAELDRFDLIVIAVCRFSRKPRKIDPTEDGKRAQGGDTVAVWGCGPVGQMTIRSAILLGAKQVIAIDRIPERLSMAEAGGALTINFDEESVVERLNELTGGKGPEKCIDAIGLEAHVTPYQPDTILDRAKQMMMLENDRAHVLREMIYVCRPAGTISIPGVYSGLADKVPMGQLMNKGLTIRTGQTHVNRWTDDLLRRIEEGQIDPSFVITHSVSLEDGPEMYKVFRDKQDSCVKVVLKP